MGVNCNLYVRTSDGCTRMVALYNDVLECIL